MAQTNETRRSYGSDGKLYHQDTSDKDLKYRTVSENDHLREQMRSLEMTKSLEMMNGKIDSHGNPTRPKSAASYIPPKLGTTSKSKRVEKRAWEKEMGLTQEQPKVPTTTVIPTTRSDPETNDHKLLEAITTLQNKYEENLQVIDQLFLEKQEMTKKVQLLEFKLQKALSPQRKPVKTPSVPPRYSSRSPPRVAKMNQTSSSMSRYQKDDSSGDEAIYERPASRLNLTSPGLLQQHKSLSDDTFLHGGDQSLPNEFNNNQLSALEAARFFAEDEPPVVTSRSAKSLPTRSVYEPSPRRDSKSTVRPGSAPKRERYSTSTSPIRGRNAKTISSSITRSSSLKRSGPSPHIQADTDRYVDVIPHTTLHETDIFKRNNSYWTKKKERNKKRRKKSLNERGDVRG